MAITWITGNSGAGKTTLARKMQTNEIILDGDDMRKVWEELGFSRQDRWTQNLRIAVLASVLEGQGFDIIVATICPYKELRRFVKEMAGCKFIYLKGGKKPSKEYPYEN